MKKQNINYENRKFLYEAILQLKDMEECEAFFEDFRSFSVAVAWRAISFEQEFADIGIGIWVAFAIDGIACCQGTELRTLRHGLA